MSVIDKIRNEPVLVTSLVGSVLALGVAFGFSLSDVQIAALLAVVNSLLAVFARGKVSPVAPESREDAI